MGCLSERSRSGAERGNFGPRWVRHVAGTSSAAESHQGRAGALNEPQSPRVTSFEFVFSLFSILLGLALAQVLRGFADVVEAGSRIRIGWPTFLLALVVMADITLFWRVVWRAREYMPDTSTALFVTLIISGLYYFAAVMVFPRKISGRDELDTYFLAQKGKVLGCLLAANIIAHAGRYALMGQESFAVLSWTTTVEVASFAALCVIGILVDSRKAGIGIVAALLLINLIDPITGFFATPAAQSG